MAFCCNETIIMSSSCKLQFLAALRALFPPNTMTYILLTKLYFINYIRKLLVRFSSFCKKVSIFQAINGYAASFFTPLCDPFDEDARWFLSWKSQKLFLTGGSFFCSPIHSFEAYYSRKGAN